MARVAVLDGPGATSTLICFARPQAARPLTYDAKESDGQMHQSTLDGYRWPDLPDAGAPPGPARRGRPRVPHHRRFVAAVALFAVSAVALWLHGMENRTIARVEQQTEAVRGLHPPHPVPVTLLAPDAFRRLVHDVEDTPAALADRRRLGRAYALLGLIPIGTDLARLLSDRSESQVIGLYVPTRQRLYVETQPDTTVFGLGRDLSLYDQGTLAHEYTHALQDQIFGYRYLVGPSDSGRIHNTDRDLAIEAVIEGDAEETRILQAQRSLTRSQIADLNSQIAQHWQAAQAALAPLHLPPVVTDVARFPYDQGQSYVQHLVVNSGGSLAPIDAIYRARSFPCSTWVIMQDTGLIHDDSPDTSGCDTVAVPAPPNAAGWTLRDSDVVGALRLHDLDAGLATRWAADRYAIYTRGHSTVLVWDLRVRLMTVSTASTLAQHTNASFGTNLSPLFAGGCVTSSTGTRATAAIAVPSLTGDVYLAVSTDAGAQALVADAVRSASGC